MRPYCPICNHSKRRDSWTLSFRIPDGWTLPAHNTVCLCQTCGMIWYDNDATQADYDTYYATKYCDYGLDTPEHHMRQEGIVEAVFWRFPRTARIADFRGGLGYVGKRLRALGYQDVVPWNVGDAEPVCVDLIIASHVLEHVYDLRETVEAFARALVPDGCVLAEVPDALRYATLQAPPLLDYQTQHINHFTPFCLDYLFARGGFSCIGRQSVQFQQYTNYRALYRCDHHLTPYTESRRTIRANMGRRIAALQRIAEPVIVYGCADTTWYLLDKVPGLPVAYYVDENTAAYPPGSTIGGVPVQQAVTSAHPILVLAAGQRAAILAKIRAAGLKNEIIQV